MTKSSLLIFIWGTVANIFGIPITLLVASLALAATIIAKKRYSSTLLDDLDFTPATNLWSFLDRIESAS